MNEYEALLEPSEQGGFVVTFPDFGYGVSQAETESEALELAADLPNLFDRRFDPESGSSSANC